MANKLTKTDVAKTKAWVVKAAGWSKQEWRKLTAWTVALLAAIVALAALGIYGFGWQNWYSGLVSKVVPFPAAYIGSHTISYHSYYGRMRLLAAEAHRNGDTTTGKEMAQDAMGQLVSEAEINNYAASNNLKLTDAQIDSQLEVIFSNEGGDKKALQELKDDYGLNKAQYRDLLKGRLLTTKVDNAIQSSPDSQQQAYNQASKVLKDAKGGQDYNQLAARYSQDVSGLETGDQALRAASGLPGNLPQAAAKLKDGQLYDGVLSAQGNYYLIKRIKTVNGQAEVRIILFKAPGLDQWLASQLKHDKQVNLLPQLH